MASSGDNLIINSSSFVPTNDVAYTKPRVNKAGGKAVGIINAHSNRQLMISTPLMMTWGVNERRDEQTGKVSYDMSLQFPNEQYHTEQTRAFLNAMNEFEQKIKSDAIVNSKAWLNKATLNEAQADVLFHPMLYRPADPEKAPALKVKLDYWDEKFTCEMYDLKQNLLFPSSSDDNITPCDLITKGGHVACIIKCGGIWFANGKFGVTWKLVQAVVKPKATIQQGKCYIELSDEDKQKLETQTEESKEVTETTTEVSNKPTTEVDDSDEENDETEHTEEPEKDEQEVEQEEEPEPEPEPEPKPEPKKPKRKVVRKA